MKMQKYIDMAYGNPRGLEWINLIHSEMLWDKWCRTIHGHATTKWTPDKDRPGKVLTAAIWHFGYAHDAVGSRAVLRTAWRLRRGDLPPERGAGVLNRGLPISGVEIRTFGMPIEFWALENFLEHDVRPCMESSTKLEG